MRGGKGGDQAAASGLFQSHRAAGCGEGVKSSSAVADAPAQSCGVSPAVGLLSRDSGVGGTWMGPAGSLPAPGAAGVRGYTALALGMGWGKAGNETGCFVSQFLLSCRRKLV